MLGGPMYIIQILLLCTKHIQNKKEKYKKVQPFSSYQRSKGGLPEKSEKVQNLMSYCECQYARRTHVHYSNRFAV